MSSRRKASTPCMIRQDQTMVELDDEADESHDMEVRTPEPWVVTAISLATFAAGYLFMGSIFLCYLITFGCQLILHIATQGKVREPFPEEVQYSSQ